MERLRYLMGHKDDRMLHRHYVHTPALVELTTMAEVLAP